MGRLEPLATARKLVAERFPGAVQAWLAGSVVLGTATERSDLDITVLLDHADVHRESLVFAGWPVELFVHEESSIRHFVAKDVERRRPTMARLVATGIPLLEGDRGAGLRAFCEGTIADGPGSLRPEELDFARYGLTDLLDDLQGGGPEAVLDAVIVGVWKETAELLLGIHAHWSGSGKWLVRELEDLDRAQGTSYSPGLHRALHQAFGGDTSALAALAGDVLEMAGGALWAGFHLAASLPEKPG